MSKTVKVVGPFFTNYSLARVNRGLAAGINSLGTEFLASLYVSSEDADFYPSDEELNSKPNLKELFRREDFVADFAIYNNFPKNAGSPLGLAKLNARIKVVNVAWEESIYPQLWVDELNEHANGVMVISSFVRDILFNSGVRVPIEVVPCALDADYFDSEVGTLPYSTSKSFKFVHVSTGKRRKGVDLLIRAYFEKFSSNDDVVLIIKSFPGPDNDIDIIISELKTESSPEIIHINNPDVPEHVMKNLHKSASAEVYPSRSEGFGLPILEAMYYGKPVIATGYSGYLDFLNEDNGYLVDYSLVPTNESELVNIGARWAEPDLEDLGQKMRHVFDNYNSAEVELKMRNAVATASEYTWSSSASKAINFLRQLEEVVGLKNKSILVVSPYNDETGIAEYTEKIYSNIYRSFKEFVVSSNIDISNTIHADEDFVVRNWSLNDSEFLDLVKFVQEKKFDIVHLQYHPGAFTSAADFNVLLEKLNKLSRVFVTLHAVRGKDFDLIESIPNLKLVEVFIHNQSDVYHAQNLGLPKVSKLPLYKIQTAPRSKTWLRKKLGISEHIKILATHGLLNTNKGIPEIIQAMDVLKDNGFHLLCLNAVSQNNIYAGQLLQSCRDEIEKLQLNGHVRILTEFLDEEVIMLYLEASDYVIFNYSDAGESASAAVNKGLASRNPVLITEIPQFSEFSDECFKLESNSSESIVRGIEVLSSYPDLRKNLVTSAAKYIEANSNYRVALKQMEMIS